MQFSFNQILVRTENKFISIVLSIPINLISCLVEQIKLLLIANSFSKLIQFS